MISPYFRFWPFLPFCQTGSGKTFTMGSGHGGVPMEGAIIPHVLDALFSLVQQSKETTECQIRVSLVEVRPSTPFLTDVVWWEPNSQSLESRYYPHPAIPP